MEATDNNGKGNIEMISSFQTVQKIEKKMMKLKYWNARVEQNGFFWLFVIKKEKLNFL